MKVTVGKLIEALKQAPMEHEVLLEVKSHETGEITTDEIMIVDCDESQCFISNFASEQDYDRFSTI